VKKRLTTTVIKRDTKIIKVKIEKQSVAVFHFSDGKKHITTKNNILVEKELWLID
jgi:hypothetical protein